MPLAIDNDVLVGILLAILVMTLVFLINKSNRYFARQRARQSEVREALSPRNEAASSSDGARELARWEVQLHERARELCGQLDSKMIALQALVAEADRSAARLEKALRQKAAAEPHPANQADSLRSGRHTETEEPAAQDRGPTDRPKEEIYTLADYGFSIADIAQRVGVPIGEVQLILSLRGAD